MQQEMNDEIELLDLFLVLIRRRRLIIIMTLIFLAAAVGGYFFLPVRQYRAALDSRKAEVQQTLSLHPLAAELGVGDSIGISHLTQPTRILEALKAAGFETLRTGGPRELSLASEEETSLILSYIKQRFVENKGSAGNSLKDSDRILLVQKGASSPLIQVMFRDADPQKAVKFIQGLCENTNSALKETYAAQARQVVLSYEQMWGQENLTGMQPSSKEQIIYNSAHQFLNGDLELLSYVGAPEIFEKELTLEQFRDAFKTKAIILVMAGFFLSLFAAFLLDAVYRLKNNEASMKKIRAALGKE
jgi:hypothetical protein